MEDPAEKSYMEIAKCLTFGEQHSFLLPAGAGAGKTTALTNAIQKSLTLNKDSLFYTGSQIAAITYTRAAANEILRRVEYDQRVWVSTIHSFAWEMIKSHPLAIRDALITLVTEKVEIEIEKKSRERKTTTPTAIARARSIQRNQERLARLPQAKKFYYSPESRTPGRGELSHADVISVFAVLLAKKPLMKSFLVSRFPIVFIDEAQDTTKSLLPTFIEVTHSHKDKFTLGLFGDTMQRVYFDGVNDIEAVAAKHWHTIPPLGVNYRSDRRIVTLANNIRSQAGSEYEQKFSSQVDGTIRLFALPKEAAGYETELRVQRFMAGAANDSGWDPDSASDSSPLVKTLVLEHRFAADRLGFLEFHDAMNDPAVKEKMFGREDVWPSLVTFLDEVTTLIGYLQDGNFRKADRQLTKIRSEQISANHLEQDFPTTASSQLTIQTLRQSAQCFKRLIDDESHLSLGFILQAIRTSKVFPLPEEAEECLVYFEEIKASQITEGSETDNSQTADQNQKELQAWSLVLPLPLEQFVAYLSYRKGTSSFDTQQGVKGLEFPRVLVVLNDNEARGKLFQYDKIALDGELSATDEKNQADGKDTGLSRARRLFYVSCTRAKNSLAVVYYGDGITHLGKYFRELFHEDEIISWNQLVEAGEGGDLMT